MKVKQEIIKQIKGILTNLGVVSPEVVLDYPSEMSFGDLSTNVAMVYSKQLGKNPLDLATEIKSHLEAELPSDLEKMEVVKPGFINFFFTPEYFAKNLNKKLENQLENQAFSGQKVFFEHSQPNPFKEFHIGHLMGNCIGESVARILKENGAEMKIASYHGDVGLHVAKAVWALKKGINFEKAYSEGHKAYEDSEIEKKEILEINKKIYERSDPEINKIYDDGRKKSLESFELIYKTLDSHFDYHFYESESEEIGVKLVKENIGRVFEEGERGAIIFKGDNFEPKTHTRVFLSSEGLPVYEAKELGLAKIKKDIWNFDKSITVTANEQDSFFRVVEVAIGEVFPELKGKLKHLSHGMLKLPTGKMSSRTGTIISADNLINQVADKVYSIIRDRGGNKLEHFPSMMKGSFDIHGTSAIIAIGAIKYSILRQAIGGDIVFDFDKSISFEGDSGPYLQYSTVRAKSVLEKARGINLEAQLPSEWKTTDLERLITRFLSVVERASKEYAPHYIVTYLTKLAGEFNAFYASHKIIDENDSTSSYRLAITRAFAEVMEKGLDLLGIKVPEKM